ncbi:hypothetical protein [Oryza sativa Japonica Group]|uniref:Uncharacterized protein n=1 Tax=Oryza sativa subsp. japonica TaxID=39947 RepID=Q5N831_ORYSJ|nr:hypothetical protein [Oryza sativa Japonica Group]
MHRRMQHVIDKTTQRCVSMRLTPDGVEWRVGQKIVGTEERRTDSALARSARQLLLPA